MPSFFIVSGRLTCKLSVSLGLISVGNCILLSTISVTVDYINIFPAKHTKKAVLGGALI